MKKKYYKIPKLAVKNARQFEDVLASPASEGSDTLIYEEDLTNFGKENGWFSYKYWNNFGTNSDC